MSTLSIDSVQELLNKAYQSWNEGDSTQAENLCQSVLAEAPDQPDALHLMGIIAHATQRPDLAIDYLRQACQSPIAPAQFFTNLAEILRQQGQLAEAKLLGQQALALDESLPSGLFNFGRILQDLKEFEESSLYFRRAIALDPDNAQSYFYLAHADMGSGRLKEVEENFLKAIEKDPNFAKCYSSLAVFYFNSLLYPKALEYSQKALDIDPTIAEAYLNIADIESDRHSMKIALVWVDALLEFEPHHVRALNTRAWLCSRMERFDDAFASVNLALNIKPNW